MKMNKFTFAFIASLGMSFVQAGVYAVFDVHTVDELTNACAQATFNFNTIRVHPGVYDLTGCIMSSGHHLVINTYSGQFIGMGANPGETVIKGGGSTDNCRLLEVKNNYLTVSNLTFTGGHCIGSTSSGGVACSKNPTFTDCIFTNNYAENFGGALDQPKSLTRCRFIGNWAGNSGGVLRPMTDGSSLIRDCYFEGNHAPRGGVSYYDATYSNCVFIGNYAENGPGCLRSNSISSSMNVCIDCSFTNNWTSTGSYSVGFLKAATNCVFYGHAWSELFGLKQQAVGCELTANTGMPLLVKAKLERCVLRDNFGHRSNSNPLFHGCAFQNCLIVGNQSGSHDMSTLFNKKDDVKTSLLNCTVVSNTILAKTSYSVCADGFSINTIFTGNQRVSGTVTNAHDFGTTSVTTTTNCIWSVANGTAAAELATNPKVKSFASIRFVNPSSGDYHLASRSPARDAGWSDEAYLAELGSVDLDGNDRIGQKSRHQIIDIGCYECQLSSPGFQIQFE